VAGLGALGVRDLNQPDLILERLDGILFNLPRQGRCQATTRARKQAGLLSIVTVMCPVKFLPSSGLPSLGSQFNDGLQALY